MNNISNKERRRIKKEAILESARTVFCRKGFIGVTMKDIIDECGISRGGIYLYFDSVDAIFVETSRQRTNRKFDGIRKAIKDNPPFDELLDSYFAEHKDRLLNHMSKSMLRSMYEYFFTHKSEEDQKFQQAQLEYIKKTIAEILQLGVRQGVLRDDAIDDIAENFMLMIEGLSVSTLIGRITEELIDRQFAIMRSLLPRESEINK